MKKIIIVTFLFNVFFAANIFAADFGKITITERQPFGAEFFASGASTQHGYAEYRFLVQNHDNIPHKVKISIEPRSHYRSGTIIFSMDTAEIAAGSHTNLRLLQPPILIDSSLSATVNIDGWERDLTLNADNHMNNSRFGYTSSVHSTVCFSQQVPTTIREFFARRSTLPPDDEVKATPPPPTMSHSSPANMLTSMYSNVPVDDWSDSWISYTRFDSVAITSVEWNDLITRKPAVLSAIKRYVEAGGILIMVGKDWEIPAEWESIFKTKPKDKGIDATIVCGKVFVIGSNSAEVAADAPHFDNIIKQIDIASGIEKQRIEFAQNLYRNNQIISRMHEILPVVTEYGVNVRLILVLIIVFAILIGPVNVFVLKSINRRIWLIWTVPATSLIASFLVILISFMNEGLLRQSSSWTCTFLDQRRGAATTFGVIGYYSTFSPGNLTFSSDVELLPFFDNDYGTREFRIDASGNQVLIGGWVSPRVPSYFSLRKSQLQQKLQVTFNWSDANKPTATNGLGAEIESIRACSPTGEIYEAHNIMPGEQTVLSKSARPISKITEETFYTNLREIQHNDIMTHHVSRNGTIEQIDFPCSYNAIINDWNPFLEQGIPNTKPFRHKTTIIGLYQ